ncbi:MAG: F0F1 ATP synthase subunit A, partial [Clostridiales bacterium]
YVFLLPLMLIDEFVRPLSLSLRLFGNIYGEEEVTAQLFNMVPLLIPLAMNALSLLMGFVQAMVFVMLSSVYIGGAAGEGH